MTIPIFIFSMPRSGSTLLQRLLMGHRSIASVSEPWIMLPFAYTTKNEGVLSEYSHMDFYRTFGDFKRNLPEGDNDFYRELKQFVTNLYTLQCKNGEIYFLDKTPRYHLIIDEIYKTFPNAKFIFLFRNPVHVISSLINTFCQGKLTKLFTYHNDILYGFANLSNAYSKMKDVSISVNYENLMTDTQGSLKQIFEYLDLSWDDDIMSNFKNQDLKGEFGDPSRSKENFEITYDPDQWKKYFENPIRRNLLIDYIKKLKMADLKLQGYDKSKILKDIKSNNISFKGTLSDIINLIYSKLVRLTKAYMLFGETAKWSRGKHLS